MKIVVTGGGSGGHITPILAVASELKKLAPDCEIDYIGAAADILGDIPRKDPNLSHVYEIRAGKFRRYHSEGWRQLLDISTMLKNVRDFFYFLIGTWQSYRLLRRVKPEIIFIKGGFVGVPVGLAAAVLHIPFVTHDSDAIPGLANRIIARWATRHAVALPEEIYPYPIDKTITTGIPLRGKFEPVTAELRQKYRREINIDKTAKLLFIIGGGLGSQQINQSIAEIVPHLLAEFPDLQVIHGVGRANEVQMNELYAEKLTAAEQGRVRVEGYFDDVYRYSGAADLIVTRAGATNLAEFALQGKSCVVIPSPFLTGGHQLKNAKVLADKNAVVVLDETELSHDPNRLAKLISSLFHDPKRLTELARNFYRLARPNAAHDLAMVLLEQAKKPIDET